MPGSSRFWLYNLLFQQEVCFLDTVPYLSFFHLFLNMPPRIFKLRGRAERVLNNLKQGMSLAWAASPRLLIRYTLLGMFNSIVPPFQVWLGAKLVNKIAEARIQPLEFNDM